MIDLTSQICYHSDEFYSDEPPLESDLHLQQIFLLISCLDWLWQERNNYYATGNLTIYYSENEKKSEKFRGPDFFVVLNTEKRPRKSWVVWQENYQYPNVIVEILSDSTAKVDRETKKLLYQDTFQTPNYFWFDPVTLEFQGFTLREGVYQPIQANEQGYLWSKQLELYLGILNNQLRYFTPEGNLVPTPKEAALEKESQLILERQRLILERQRSNRFLEILRNLGIDPDI
jgi:Uma2 family endonuclease